MSDNRIVLREFTQTKYTNIDVRLETDVEDDVTSIMVGDLCVASYKGAYSDIAEAVYYDMLKKASKDGWKIS